MEKDKWIGRGEQEEDEDDLLSNERHNDLWQKHVRNSERVNDNNHPITVD